MNEPEVIDEMLGDGRGRTIAVVGLSENPGKPSHYVSAYMQQHGYKIYPVNPSLASVLGDFLVEGKVAAAPIREMIGDQP